jgi:hypothetical protein
MLKLLQIRKPEAHYALQKRASLPPRSGRGIGASASSGVFPEAFKILTSLRGAYPCHQIYPERGSRSSQLDTVAHRIPAVPYLCPIAHSFNDAAAVMLRMVSASSARLEMR